MWRCRTRPRTALPGARTTRRCLRRRLTFTAGQTEKTVTVATTEDDLTEADETFTVSLTVPDGVTLPDGVSVDADKDEATGDDPGR